jgi:hypothetical protein
LRRLRSSRSRRSKVEVEKVEEVKEIKGRGQGGKRLRSMRSKVEVEEVNKVKGLGKSRGLRSRFKVMIEADAGDDQGHRLRFVEVVLVVRSRGLVEVWVVVVGQGQGCLVEDGGHRRWSRSRLLGRGLGRRRQSRLFCSICCEEESDVELGLMVKVDHGAPGPLGQIFKYWLKYQILKILGSHTIFVDRNLANGRAT